MSTLFGHNSNNNNTRHKKRKNTIATTTTTTTTTTTLQNNENKNNSPSTGKQQHTNSSEYYDDVELLPFNSETNSLTITTSSSATTTLSSKIIAAVATTPPSSSSSSSLSTSFADLGLVEPLVNVCQNILSYKIPTPVQRTMIPYLLSSSTSQQRHKQQPSRYDCCVTAATGSGKTASYVLPMIHDCSIDPITIHSIIITPTRELAVQIHQQVILFGTTTYNIKSLCIVGGTDIVAQSNTLHNHPPHIVVSTPGRLATIVQNPCPPRNLQSISYLIIDEADRIFPISNHNTITTNTNTTTKTASTTTDTNCGFTKDMEIILRHIYHPPNRRRQQQQQKPTLLFFSATCTNQNYNYYQQQIVNVYIHDNNNNSTNEIQPTLQRFIISEDFSIQEDEHKKDTNDQEEDHQEEDQTGTTTTTSTTITTNNIPAGLKQEYIFMPSQVRDAYLLGTIRTVLAYGGTKVKPVQQQSHDTKRHSHTKNKQHLPPTRKKHKTDTTSTTTDYDDTIEQYKAQSAILFVSTCERAGFVSELLKQVGIPNVTLHSLVSTQQSVRNKILHQFQSEYVRIIVATDIASRGLDLPRTDIVMNVDVTNISPMTYIHRIGRTARAGRRGRAISFVTENDISTIQQIEGTIHTTLQLCTDMNDTLAMSMLSTAVKASRLARIQLEQMNFHGLLQKMKERKVRDQYDRRRQQQQQQQKKKKKKQQDEEP